VIFVELPLFTRHARFTDDELAALQHDLSAAQLKTLGNLMREVLRDE
jgi:hypothetical protein